MRGKAMADKAGDLLDLFQDVLLTARLDDKARFRQVPLVAGASVPALQQLLLSLHLLPSQSPMLPHVTDVVRALLSRSLRTECFAGNPRRKLCPGLSGPSLSFTRCHGTQMVLETKSGLESGAVSSGHSFAAARLDAQRSIAGWIGEQTGGLSYLQNIRKLAQRVDSDWEGVRADLHSIR